MGRGHAAIRGRRPTRSGSAAGRPAGISGCARTGVRTEPVDTRPGPGALVLAGLVAACLFCANPARAVRPLIPAPATPDSLEEFAPNLNPADWDSVTAGYDASIRHEPGRVIVPRYGLRFNKVEGLHLEAGGSLRDQRLRIGELDLRAGYDLGRERPNGSLLCRVELGRNANWGIEAEASDDARPFGNHRPYGNTWLTLLGGYDAMQYQRERRLGFSLTHRFSEDRRLRLGWIRIEQDPMQPVTDFRFFGNGYWMEHNEQAESFTGNGVRLHLRRGANYEGETVVRGLVTDTELLVFGGKWIGGSREFSRLQADAWYTKIGRRNAAVRLRGSASLATGDAPRQAWPDLGGAAGLWAFPPRGDGTSDSLVGNSRFLLRVEGQSPAATLRSNRIKALRSLGLKLVPFVEVGAVWGLDPEGQPASGIHEIHEWSDLRAPKRSEVRWDLGFGLRRNIDYSGILSYLEVDLAWPMGADTGSPRLSIQFSRDGLD